MEQKVAIICGPTCSGKTELSLLLAQKINSEIISADSRQIYKFLNIGTAKPNSKELCVVEHHLINFLDPSEEYNASKFEKDALEIISNLQNKQILPIVVGGSGLYIKALVDGIFDSVDTDEEFRNTLINERTSFGNEFIYNKLQIVDPKSAEKLLPQNWKRVIRALEVYYLTGEPIWKHQENHTREINIDFLQFGLNWDREILYSNIEKRVDKMIKIGLVDEIENVLSNGYKKDLNALNTVGYKEIIEFLEKKISLERAVELIKRNTRRYAKRQLTWFRKDQRIKWFSITHSDDIQNIANQIHKEVIEL